MGDESGSIGALRSSGAFQMLSGLKKRNCVLVTVPRSGGDGGDVGGAGGAGGPMTGGVGTPASVGPSGADGVDGAGAGGVSGPLGWPASTGVGDLGVLVVGEGVVAFVRLGFGAGRCFTLAAR
jgi:hypothetical protein